MPRQYKISEVKMTFFFIRISKAQVGWRIRLHQTWNPKVFPISFAFLKFKSRIDGVLCLEPLDRD